MKKQQHRPKFDDSVMVVRVKNYLAENVDKTFVDVGQMARSLKERYREYSNRNDGAFQQMVESAYKVVLRNYGLEGLDDGSSSERSEEEDSDEMEMLDDSNNLNDRLMAMYKMQESNKITQGKKDKGANKNTEELIDISSDDDSNAEKAAKLPKLSDQVTITPHLPEIPPHKTLKQTENSPHVSNQRNDRKFSNSNSIPEGKKRKPNDYSTEKHLAKRRVSEAPKTESKVTFDNVGGISSILEQVGDLLLHMRHPEVYRHLGIKAPQGALLHGPPGTGKTLLANAIAGTLRLPMITITATELVGGVSGESEERIRKLFERATASSPCVLFIDEIDAICANRLNAQKDMERRIVSQLLSSIDGLTEKNVSVLVLAATNNPDTLDPALRRSGRLEQEIALGIPSLQARKDILKVICMSIALDEDVDLNTVAQLTPGFVGADLQALVNKACTMAIKRVFKVLRTLNEKFEKIDKQNVNVNIVAEDEVDSVNSSTMCKLPNGDNSLQPEADINGKEPIVEVSNSGEEKVEESAKNINKPEGKEKPTEEERKEVKLEETQIEIVKLDESKSNLKIIETTTIADEAKEILRLLEETEPVSPDKLSGMLVCQNDFIVALKFVKPCAMREGIVTVPDVTWSDIGSLKDVRAELQLAVIAPVKYPKELAILGLEVPSGILLCGPPGCGKTLLAKAVANEAGINFISVKGPELLNMYVGESERAVRTCFQRARNSAPCVIFFDEFDALCPKRSQGDIGGASRVVNQLLTEMDGIEGRQGVFVLAATNRPDIIDPAVLRPGRLDKVVYVGMPQLQDRIDILNTITKKGTKPPMSDKLDVSFIANATEGFTGADLAGLVRQAATHALAQFVIEGSGSPTVSPQHFHKALAEVKPSVSTKEQQHYEKLRIRYASTVIDETAEVEMDTVSTNEESMDTV